MYKTTGDDISVCDVTFEMIKKSDVFSNYKFATQNNNNYTLKYYALFLVITIN